MKSLYVTSIERFSGKTAVCMALGKHFQADGYRVGYLKPLSLQPVTVNGQLADQDAAFVKEALRLDSEPSEISPLVVTNDLLRQQIDQPSDLDLLQRIQNACERAGQDKDLLVLEGGGSLREGHVFGLPTPVVAKSVDSKVLIIIRYRDDVQVLDDSLAAFRQFKETTAGVLINRVPDQAIAFINHSVAPYLEAAGLPVLSVLPETRALAALTVGELVEVLGAQVITRFYRPQSIVENFTVGAMGAESALTRFRQQSHKAVITGGDRTDIQLAALETSTTCLILTGNLQPSPLVLKQAEEFGVAVLLAPRDTMEVIDMIQRFHGKTRLSHPTKFRKFQTLFDQHLDYARLARILGLVARD